MRTEIPVDASTWQNLSLTFILTISKEYQQFLQESAKDKYGVIKDPVVLEILRSHGKIYFGDSVITHVLLS